MKIIQSIIRDINEKLAEERSLNPNATSVSITLLYGKRIVEAYITEEEVQVNILSAKDYSKFYENVCAYIEERITLWNDVEVEHETEWNLNGFADHADYLRYKYAI